MASPDTLLQKAWSVNAFLASERDRYRKYYTAVQQIIFANKRGSNESAYHDITKLKLEKGDVSSDEEA